MTENNAPAFAAMLAAVVNEGHAGRGASAAFAASAVECSAMVDAGMSYTDVADTYALRIAAVTDPTEREDVKDYAYGRSSVPTHATLGYFLRIAGEDVVADPRKAQGDIRRLTVDAGQAVALKIMKAAETRALAMSALRKAAKAGAAAKAAKAAAKAAETAETAEPVEPETVEPSKASDAPETVETVPSAPETVARQDDSAAVKGAAAVSALRKAAEIFADGAEITEEARSLVATLAAFLAQVPATV